MLGDNGTFFIRLSLQGRSTYKSLIRFKNIAKISTTTQETVAPSTRCDGCNRAIAAGGGDNFQSIMLYIILIILFIVQFVQHENKRFHKECLNIDVRCGKCSKPVFGEVIAAIDKNWFVLFLILSIVFLNNNNFFLLLMLIMFVKNSMLSFLVLFLYFIGTPRASTVLDAT